MRVPHRGLQPCIGLLWSGPFPPGRLALVGSIAHTLWAAAAWASADPATGSPQSWRPRADRETCVWDRWPFEKCLKLRVLNLDESELTHSRTAAVRMWLRIWTGSDSPGQSPSRRSSRPWSACRGHKASPAGPSPEGGSRWAQTF